MLIGRWQQRVVVGLVIGAVVMGCAQPVFAVDSTSSSAHYQISESQFGSSSTDQNCSTTYCAQAGVGGTASGSSASASYGATFGPVTDGDPLLQVIVDPGTSDLGTFSASATSTKTLSVKIRSYLSSGYIVQVTGTPPHYGSHVIGALSSPTSSTPGTEQFGLNAVANTTPAIGVDPVQVPSGSFSFGKASTGYDTANKFQYKSGDTIAQSDKSSGETDFTVSMIVNVSNKTPAGQYASDFSVVVIPSY